MTHADLLSIVLKVLGATTAVYGALFTSRYVYMLLPGRESEWFSAGGLAVAIVTMTLGLIVAGFSHRIAKRLFPRSRRFTNRVRGSSASAVVLSGLALLLFSRAILHVRVLVEAAASKPPWDELRATEYLLNWQGQSVQDALVFGAASVLSLAAAILEFRRGAAA